MKQSFYSLIFLITFLSAFNNPGTKSIHISVDASKILHTMKGGMGASWHAISAEFPFNNEKYTIPVRETGARGSAFGGNPPVSDKKAWQQIKDYASWLGMNFVRVELSQRMYEPEKGQFDWKNEEMQALYNILDWAQENDVDVFLQQMWMNVEWNALPGIHPLISAPKDLNDYANGIATIIEYLTLEKGYTCIKYFCMTNEPPGGTWGYWWEYGENEGNIKDAWARLRKEFDDRNISIPISGPDWTDMPPFDHEKLDMANNFGAIDIHSYHGVTDEGEANLKKWADWAHTQGKPFFLTEYGNMNLGWGKDDPNQKSFDAAISNACDVIRGLRANVDAFNRWSFTNRGDLDGQWQLVKTYDIPNKKYLSVVNPEPEAYYGFGIISRFLSKYSKVLECNMNISEEEVMSIALMSPKGEISIILVNKANESRSIIMNVKNFEGEKLNHYLVTKDKVNETGFKLEPVSRYEDFKKLKIDLPSRSISNLSSYHLLQDDKGIFLQ